MGLIESDKGLQPWLQIWPCLTFLGCSFALLTDTTGHLSGQLGSNRCLVPLVTHQWDLPILPAKTGIP